MVKHIVMWRLKASAEGRDKRENAIAVKKTLESLKQQIAEIQRLEVGLNVNPGEQAFDVVLYSEFKNARDLQTYVDHPAHQVAAAYLRKVREDRVVVDYEA